MTEKSLRITELSTVEKQRYSRHLLMPQIGETGQQRLKASRVMVVGAGGLGSPVALYLAAAGVGHIGIVEFDKIDRSNLQRQILFADQQTGKPKVNAARDRLSDLNPDINIEVFPFQLTSGNALETFEGFDIVIDGSDNFPTRYLVNDACVLLGKALVYGSIYRFEGQVSMFGIPDGPCYRCLFPQPPEPGSVPSCAEGGVLGVLPGIVGTLQANEALKWLLKLGDSLSGRLLLIDALSVQFQELKIRRNPDCPVCGDAPSLTRLIDYQNFCGYTPGDAAIRQISVAELNALLKNDTKTVVVDVRRESEYRIANIGGLLIPLDQLQQRLDELDTSGKIVVHCLTGQRSARAVSLLQQHGFEDVWNLAGGIKAWAEEIDPDLPV